MTKSNWTEEEIMVAIYLYRFGYEEIGLPYANIAKLLGRTPEAIFMKLSNLLNVDQGHGGLANIGKKDAEMLRAFKDVPKHELHKQVVQFLFERTGGHR